MACGILMHCILTETGPKHMPKRCMRYTMGMYTYLKANRCMPSSLDFSYAGMDIPIRESVDSLCRDGTNMPIVHVHMKAF